MVPKIHVLRFLLFSYGEGKLVVTHPLLQIKSILVVHCGTVDPGVTGFTMDHALAGNLIYL